MITDELWAMQEGSRVKFVRGDDSYFGGVWFTRGSIWSIAFKGQGTGSRVMSFFSHTREDALRELSAHIDIDVIPIPNHLKPLGIDGS